MYLEVSGEKWKIQVSVFSVTANVNCVATLNCVSDYLALKKSYTIGDEE